MAGDIVALVASLCRGQIEEGLAIPWSLVKTAPVLETQ